MNIRTEKDPVSLPTCQRPVIEVTREIFKAAQEAFADTVRYENGTQEVIPYEAKKSIAITKASDVLQKFLNERDELTSNGADKIQEFKDCIKMLLEEVVPFAKIPDANCSCHLNAPCGDCEEFGYPRELIKNAEDLIK